MKKTKESRINVFIIRSRSKRKERREKNDLFSGFIYLLSYFNLDKIIKRETSQRVLFLSISRNGNFSRLVPFQDRIISRSKTPKFADRIRNLDRYNSDTQALSGRVCKFARRKVQTTRYRFISSFLLPDVRHWSNQSPIDPR